MTVLCVSPKVVHPALYIGLPTPPLTPTSGKPGPSRTSSRQSSLTLAKIIKPSVNYAMLRAHHVAALKYVLARLRWDQANNFYVRGQDAWYKHLGMIQDLELELKDVEEAQKLDIFSMCHAPTFVPEPHGPLSKQEYEEKQRVEAENWRKDNARLEEKSPWIKQLFIGPMTKQQYKDDRLLREMLLGGNAEFLSRLLPPENMKLLEEGQALMRLEKAKANGAVIPSKKNYEEVRMEKEKAKIRAYLEANPPPPRRVRPAIGPMTEEEYNASLPVFGPPTREKTLLLRQRAQRAAILAWLQRPWGTYNEEAGALMDDVYAVAKKQLIKEERGGRIGPKTKGEAEEDGDI